jgi:hypothetical protein
MGDRGNVVVMQSEDPKDAVWLYTHWNGSNIASDLAKALDRSRGTKQSGYLDSRWDDAPYLTRIIFCQMCPDKYHNELTSWGISTRMGDNEHTILVVNTDKKTIHKVEENALEDRRLPAVLPKGISFDAFIKKTLKKEKVV